MGRAQIQSVNRSTACKPGPDAISKEVADNEFVHALGYTNIAQSTGHIIRKGPLHIYIYIYMFVHSFIYFTYV